MTTDGQPAADLHEASKTTTAREFEADAAIFSRMAGGDESALAVLYERWSARVLAIAFSILRDNDEAEEVVEETFYQAWRCAERFDGRRGAVGTWLIVIARSRALDRLRRRRRGTGSPAAARMAAELAAQADESGSAMSGDQADRIGRSEVLAAELAALPEEQRTAVELAFFRGLTHAEIAARLALPLGTVKTRIRLAMQKLRERLATLRGDDL